MKGPYVRFQGTLPNDRGSFPGVFGLANRLAREGKLDAEQYRFWRAGNDWYDANCPNPSDADPLVYDHETHPGAVAWFKTSSTEFVTRVDGYLELLAAHGVECRRLESSDPGRIVYEDEYQVVAIPHADHEPSGTAAPTHHDG
ncbi:hypothetical protein KJK29_20510 [Streptomyces koelreuteriae]|uniref:GyrI-like small molecule binding domain-containing protein n=1 Tax=Streptomyces koelreuteriae TaxID=2838015 RepID=A0ABX8FUL1_9ACTN|nr:MULTISPECIES: hypothetical protein [Streptomyces]QWB24768.1 hypothetical protein KJK29_20510 [Streptomyces koelreuteriae]UUA07782.1 hypothetical protein NNW98_20625 [Streptomyces koelreuteriae]UUA15411.1 hypothetical protein NNW99_20620 [Streptomyces sp. CRCS-T-1]